MESILAQMQDEAQKYVDILAEILKIDVTIITADQVRIAGSGRIRKRIGDMSTYGAVTRWTIDTRSLTVVMDPSQSDICRGCHKVDSCDNKAEAWVPLVLDEQVLGVLGFVCFNEKQRQHFIRNYDLFIQFLNQFGDLLVSKARDLLAVKQQEGISALLTQVIDKVEMGILVLDQNETISHVNTAARHILNLGRGDEPVVSIQETGRHLLDLSEYQVRLDGLTYLITGKFYDIHMPTYRRLFLFRDASLDGSVAALGLGEMKLRPVDRILGVSAQTQRVKEQIRIVADSSSNVLITGESGTGKELVAVALHGESGRSKKPFVAINCGALPEHLLESELFGYVKGAFTGADSKGRAGLFEAAEGGTIFLDEIGDMPLCLQVKLLRVLEQRQVTRLGSNTPIPIDVRLVCATNKDLEAMVATDKFREDLYYRINVIPIRLAPLRERREDIRILTHSFIDKYCGLLNKTAAAVGDDFWARMESYDWPGNVRELQNVVEYSINMMPYTGRLHQELLPYKLLDRSTASPPEEDMNLEHMERAMIKRAVDLYGTTPEAKQLIAEKLGISLATLYRKLKSFKIKL